MGHTGIFPSKDAEFNDYFQRAVPYLNNNKVRLKINADNITALNNYSRSWGIIYPQSKDPDERTTAITNKKNAIRKEIETLLRKIYNDIPESVLTADDRAALNLKARDKEPTPAPVPITTPDVTLQPGSGNQVVIYFEQQESKAGASKRAKPEHVANFEFCYKIGSPAPADTDDCNKRETASRSPLRINLKESDAGKKLYGYGRWVNTRNQPGPWTATYVSIIIP